MASKLSDNKGAEIKFVVLTTARSGSGWLVDAIDHIAEVTCHGELFSQKLRGNFGKGTKIESFKAYRKTNPGIRPFITFRYLKEVFAKDRVVGFKILMSQQRNFLDVFLFLVIRRVAIIHLVRENTLDILVSKRVAWERGKFKYRTGEELPQETALIYPTDKLLIELEWTERRTSQIRALLKLLRARRIEVKYEELLKGPQAFKPVWQFLGIDFESNPPRWEIQKIRRKKLSELIANYSEVEQALSGTKYSKHLLN